MTKVWMQVAEEVYGRTEAAQLRDAISDAIEEERNFVAVYREDLSFNGSTE